jgi:hypothetical protein
MLALDAHQQALYWCLNQQSGMAEVSTDFEHGLGAA